VLYFELPKVALYLTILTIFCPALSEFENFLWCERILSKCHLSKRNVKLIVKILSDLELLRGSSNKKTSYSTRSCVNWAHSYHKESNLHTNSLNNIQGYSRETSDENFVICNPKYKKPLELDMYFV
jgi:hypothetical protein